MHIVTVLFNVNAAHYCEFMVAMRRNAADSLALEPDCLQFDVCEGVADADSACDKTVFLYEVYTRQEAFNAHLSLPHFLHFNAVTAPWVIGKTVKVFTRT
jgi:quinol monooxygenase YgiN